MNCAEFRFDVVKKGDRKIWIYKENFKVFYLFCLPLQLHFYKMNIFFMNLM